ncbi:hypothetical protein [Mucilaginibacter sp. CSA2-8R]|uniref:hypothetical protein n=1 Tax=Mucilaginibacter sp. CSA2-8R TaxID=3141542 RepID=UPI00315DB3E6
MQPMFIMQGRVMWSFDYEMAQIAPGYKMMSGLTGIGGPLHHHRGLIALSSTELIIEGDNDEEDEFLSISLSAISELYHGYDDVYQAYSVKNAGLFWQPLRITFYSAPNQLQTIYLIVDYLGMITQNKKWYYALTEMLAED